MLWILLTAGICVNGCYSLITRSENDLKYKWSSWSTCSTTCGDGVQQRTRGDEKENRHCFLQFCPSYLSWPRIHFSGPFTEDSNTVNNIRCAYENEQFSASQLSKEYIALGAEKDTHVYYKKKTGNWNPGGSNHIYFSETYVRSFCTAPGTCSTNASIVGLQMSEAARGVVSVLDTDWQFAIEIWAWRIRIPGVLEADYVSSSQHVETVRVVNITRNDYGYAHPLMTRYKSKLVNITWNDEYYKKTFKNATELSINFVIDLYNQYSFQGRFSGTIGLTSPDDPKEVMATRTIRPPTTDARENAPFFIHQDKRVMTLDFGMSIVGRDDGRIISSDTGQLDLVILITRNLYCKTYSEDGPNICSEGNLTDLVPQYITAGGELSKRIGDDAVWYLTYGGVMDIDLNYLDDKTWSLLQNSRVAVIEQNDGVETIYMSEFPKGIVVGLKDSQTIRLNPGENVTWHTFVSSFGKPAVNTEIELFVVDRSNADTDCGRPSCNLTSGVPRNALQITPTTPKSLTDASGLVTFSIKAVADPGNVRGCGLDGQIYPLRMLAKFNTGKRVLTFSESGLYTTGKPADFPSQTLSICARIYNSVEEKTCPTWNDVKDIFIQYYNLYPVMWNVGIIDLHSYKDIRRKSSMLKVSMFDYDFNDPRYMPVSRDLSAGKKNLIWNWLQCGMRQFDPPPKEKKKATQQCTKEFVEKEIQEIRVLLNHAVLFELSTVPPYVTAWLSLKTEYGRNKEIADILESVFDEEMLHMSLSANVLNAIGGRVDLTDDSKLPIYPTILASGSSYQLSPNVQVTIEPFSIGLVENIFSAVEMPADLETREVFYILAKIWEDLPKSDLRSSHKMQLLLKEMHMYSGFDESSEHMENDESENPEADVAQLKTWKVLKKYATDALKKIKKKLGKTVGDLYARISLRLTVVECCLKIAHFENTVNNVDNIFSSSSIFNGNQSFQLNQAHWYQENFEGLPESAEYLNVDKDNGPPDNASLIRPPLFDVVDLSSALEGIVEIVHQGEGGSECSPFIADPDVYASYRSREAGFEASHYFRFQEIVHGKRLIKIKNPPSWSNVKCLNASLCPSLLKANESYCYAGETIPYYEDGVWPILSNPLDGNYEKGSRVYEMNHQFNLLYTRLLFCLQDTFGGQPSNIKTCMTIMYDLTIAGKHLVQMPLGVLDDTTAIELGDTGSNGSPTWRFVREMPNSAGLPLKVSMTMK